MFLITLLGPEGTKVLSETEVLRTVYLKINKRR